MEKNRQSARESRKRKTNYIATLESKIEGLESEVVRLNKVISDFKDKEKID